MAFDRYRDSDTEDDPADSTAGFYDEDDYLPPIGKSFFTGIGLVGKTLKGTVNFALGFYEAKRQAGDYDDENPD